MQVILESTQAGEESREASSQFADFCGKRVHLIGIGGSGMFGAARMLLQSGAKVSGTDQRQFDGVGELVAGGAVVHFDHNGEHVPVDADLVVRSAAVPDSNPEVASARSRSIPVICYAELLGRITASRLGVCIAGTHGKSTTTALTAHVLHSSGIDPSYICGAASQQLGGSSGVGRGPHFVVESCEYGRSFLHMRPFSAAILNIDCDHLDCYRDLDEIVAAFGEFAARVSPRGLLVVNHDDLETKQAAKNARCQVETCGFGPGADVRAVSLRARHGCHSFQVLYHGEPMMHCSLAIAGKHNVSNALAAVALARHAGATPEQIAEALASFEGISRRMSLRGKWRGVTVVDDYAHHPTEIRATLEAIRSHYSPRRTWVVFQPHQASRTRRLLKEFAGSFSDADIVLVPDIYSVRDTDDDRLSVNSAGLVRDICQNGKDSRYLPTFDDVTEHLVANLAEGDLVVTMGAGDVWKVADGLVQRPQ